MHSCKIRPVEPADAPRIVEIYNPYVLNTTVSFEEAAVSAEEMAGRIEKIAAAGLPWLVAEHDGQLVAYAYASKWRERRAYRFSVECTVYAADGFKGRGVGRALYEALFARLKADGYHAVIAVIALPNPASVALHERCGMRKVAHFPQVGLKFGQWHDVGNWQVVL
jgi:L-amino acid N-acyltransferase YncA